MNLDYQVPAHVSPEARSLLSSLLTNRVEKRATISQVMHHPWYMKGLPLSALNYNDNYLRQDSDAEGKQSIEETVRIVEKAMVHPASTVPLSAQNEDDYIDKAFEEEEV